MQRGILGTFSLLNFKIHLVFRVVLIGILAPLIVIAHVALLVTLMGLSLWLLLLLLICVIGLLSLFLGPFALLDRITGYIVALHIFLASVVILFSESRMLQLQSLPPLAALLSLGKLSIRHCLRLFNKILFT